MTRRIPRIIVMLMLSLCVLTHVELIAAQEASRPMLLVHVAEYDQATSTSKHYLLNVMPDKAVPVEAELPADMGDVHVSPDGKWLAFIQYKQGGGSSLVYLSKDQAAPTVIDMPATVAMTLIRFSPDSKYFTYSTGDFEADQWELNLVDLANNSTSKVSGKLSGTRGAPLIVGWNPDGKRVYVGTIYLEGPIGIPVEVELSALLANGTIPTDKPTLGQEYAEKIVWTEFSKDMTKMFFAYYDPARPVANYMGMGEPINTIGVHDLATGESKVIYTANQDEGLNSIIWSADSTKLLFVSGKYGASEMESAKMVAPKLIALDVATGTPSPGVSISTDPESIYPTVVCGDTFYYATVVYSTNGAATSTLYSAPLSDLTKRSAPLHTAAATHYAVECVPAE